MPGRGDVQFDGDGYVVGIRINRPKRGGKSFDGGSFRVGDIPVELGVTTLGEALAKNSEAGAPRLVVDAEFGTISVLTYDYFELEFDTVAGEQVLGAIRLTH